jgi:hypothetical protein
MWFEKYLGDFWGPLAGAAFGALESLPIYSILFATGEGRGVSNHQWHQACDVVVHRLMTTNDLVELQRDANLAKHFGLRCDATRGTGARAVSLTNEEYRHVQTIAKAADQHRSAACFFRVA